MLCVTIIIKGVIFVSIIEVKNLTKIFKYNKKYVGKERWKHLFKKEKIIQKAVDNITFTVNEGESLAFIGPNGAGKSTAIKMLTGILYPTAGEINVLGYNPTKDRIKLSKEIGTVFGQKEQLWVHLSPMDNFLFFGSIYDIPKKDLLLRIEELSKSFEINDFINQPVKSLSLGQRMKCEMVASLLHKPKILFFDEPTIGLDPIAKDTLRKLIKKMNKEMGITIFFTSHDVGDIEEVCKRVIIINNGKIVLDDSMKKLKYNYLNKKIVEVNLKKKTKLEKRKGIKVLEANGSIYKIEIDMNITSIEEIMRLFSIDDIKDISITSTSLEEIIKTIYRRNDNEKY